MSTGCLNQSEWSPCKWFCLKVTVQLLIYSHVPSLLNAPVFKLQGCSKFFIKLMFLTAISATRLESLRCCGILHGIDGRAILRPSSLVSHVLDEEEEEVHTLVFSSVMQLNWSERALSLEELTTGLVIKMWIRPIASCKWAPSINKH